jgi:hypothetical protein
MPAREPATKAFSSTTTTIIPESLPPIHAPIVGVPSSSPVVLLHCSAEGTTVAMPHRLNSEIRVPDKAARDRPCSFKDALLRFPVPHPALEETHRDGEPRPLLDQGWQTVHS